LPIKQEKRRDTKREILNKFFLWRETERVEEEEEEVVETYNGGRFFC